MTRKRKLILLFCLLSFVILTSSMIIQTQTDDLVYYYKYDKFLEIDKDYLTGIDINRAVENNSGLKMIYENWTGDKCIADEIIRRCIQFDVPLNLAFAVAKKESNFDPNAVNINYDEEGQITSVDRGIFQLNSKSFPQLTEEQMFNYKTNIYYGVSYLHYCIESFDTDSDSLIAYNAGHSNVLKVRSTSYTQDILSTQSSLDDLFNQKKEAIKYEERFIRG